MAKKTPTTTRRRRAAPRAKRLIPAPAASQRYRPYHLHGEAVLLLGLTIAGIGWLFLPMALILKLLGLIALWLVVPAIIIPQYWPQLRMHDLGWRSPAHPRQPKLYGLVVIAIAFLPVALFLLVSSPVSYVAVDAGQSWIAWMIGQAFMVILLSTLAAFFTGPLLFRLGHLIHPGMAVLMVGLLLGIANLLIPGPVRYFALPLTVAVAWVAWQTKSFVPSATMMAGVSLLYDLMVKLT